VKPLALSDLPTLDAFLEGREATRRLVIALKAKRRVPIGPHVSVVFENRDTLLWQVMEMCRVEQITDDAKRREELDVYNELMPKPGGLSATMFLELEGDALLREWLPRLIGVEGRVFFRMGGREVRAAFEEGRSREDLTSTVHYLHFPFLDADRAAFRHATEVVLGIDHPAYRHLAVLSDETRASLAADWA
jgi:hypothetical protein